MNAPELLENLTEQGVRLWVNNDKLSIRAPKGVMTPEIRDHLADNKTRLLELLKSRLTQPESCTGEDNLQGVSPSTIGRIINGFSAPTATGYIPPVVSAAEMAKRLTVTFRPLPPKGTSQTVVDFRSALKQQLETIGVTVQPWAQATRDFHYAVTVPGLNRKVKLKTRMVKTGINAVIDVERPTSRRRQVAKGVAEKVYQGYRRFSLKGEKTSALRIAQIIGWAEDNAAKFVEDPTNTQVISLADIDSEFTSRELPYQRKIEIGLNTLIRNFSEMVIGVSETKISILNMNLSDSVFARTELERFVKKSLVPKIFVPILPLPISRFRLQDYDAARSAYAQKLVDLSQSLASSSLFPAGFKLDSVIKRQSYRDIVDTIVNGRTGVSYGFVAYMEPPEYVGPVEIGRSEWDELSVVDGFNNSELRQNEQGRRYICLSSIESTEENNSLQKESHKCYKQIPDVWLATARSGANKTNLSLRQDVLRIGLTPQLVLQRPALSETDAIDLKPSYDVFVMVAIALSTALYFPELAANGAPIVHFHGYPNATWFQPQECFSGVQNPSVPCGTYESGVFNFMSISRLHAMLSTKSSTLTLAALIEPDHGTNIIAADPTYLVERLTTGISHDQLGLGGKHFVSLDAS